MVDFEKALEASLASLQLGESTEDILARFPEFSGELRPLLIVAQRIKGTESITPRPEFKAETLTGLRGFMRENPRRPVWRRPTLVARYAAAVATLVLAFTTTGFALAQNALPGGALYPWKLTSERIWRTLHSDLIYVDLEITQRRLTELIAVQNDAALQQQALDDYAAALRQLEFDIATQPQKAQRARSVVSAQKNSVDALGNQLLPEDFYTIIPSLDDLIQQNPEQDPADEGSGVLPIVATAIPLLPTVSSKDNTGNKNEDENWLDELITDLLGGG